MADIYLNQLTYLKQEIDDKMTENLTTVQGALDTKVDVAILGSPSGVSTLNDSGQVNTEQLPTGYTGTVSLGTGQSLTIVNGIITGIV